MFVLRMREAVTYTVDFRQHISRCWVTFVRSCSCQQWQLKHSMRQRMYQCSLHHQNTKNT